MRQTNMLIITVMIYMMTGLFLPSVSEAADEPGDTTNYQQLVTDILADKSTEQLKKVSELAKKFQRYMITREFKKAVPVAEALIAISKVLNKDLPGDHALILFNAGKACGGSGDLINAKKYMAETIKIADTIDLAKNPDTLPFFIKAYLDYGMLTGSLNENNTARESFQKAIVLLDREKLTQRLKVESYQKLIQIFSQHFHDDQTAALLTEKLLASFPPRSRDNKTYILTAFRLSTMYIGIGDLTKAKILLEELVERVKKVGGKDSSDLGGVYQNMFHVYEMMGDYQKAEKYGQSALGIAKANEQVLGSDSVLAAKLDLASLRLRTGELHLAEQGFQEIVDAFSAKYGKEAEVLVPPYKGLFRVYLLTDRKELAEKIAKTVYQLTEMHRQGKPMDLVKASAEYAVALYLNGKKTEAVEMMEAAYLKAVSLKGRENIAMSAISSMWGQLLANEGKYSKSYDVMNQTMKNRYDNMIDELYSLGENESFKYLERQRYLFDCLIINAVDHMAGDNSKVGNIFDTWLKYKGIVMDIEKFRQISALQSKDHDAAKIRNLFTGQMNNVDSRSLARSLAREEAYIDFARVRDFEPLTEKTKGYRYLAFVFTNGSEPAIKLVDLGKADDIDNLVKKYSREIAASTSSGFAPSERRLRDLGKDLYIKVLSPLEQSISSYRELVISPDGLLNLIPFEVMLTPDGDFLIDKYRIRTLSSARDIINRPTTKPANNLVAVFADPDYDGIGEKAPNTASFSYRYALDFGQQKFSRLQDTSREAECIAEKVAVNKALQFQLFQGAKASERNLFSIVSPNVLHIATHGYYLKKPSLASGGNDKPDGGFGLDENANVDNPLLRSGIVLAGANHSMSINSDVGIVTAQKMLSLDLKDTGLVVLSACNTGVGDVEAGDGIVGIKRSMILAGAKSVIASMWSIASKQTVDLIDNFYLGYLGGKTKGEALREAKLKLKLTYPNPFYWGALVLDGAWD